MIEYEWQDANSQGSRPSRAKLATGLGAYIYRLREAWLYERGEERYWEFLATKARLVHGVDDTRVNDYGVYYTEKNPLQKEKIKK